VRFVRRVKS